MNRVITITIICFFASLSITVGLVWPEYQDLKDLQLKIQEKDIELQSKETYLCQLEQIRGQFESHKEGMDKINSALPADISLPRLFDYFQKLSSENGLVLENIGAISSSALTKKPDIQEHLINVSVIGSYVPFKNFLVALEKSSRLVGVQSIFFNSPQEAEEEANFIFNLIVKVFSY